MKPEGRPSLSPSPVLLPLGSGSLARSLARSSAREEKPYKQGRRWKEKRTRGEREREREREGGRRGDQGTLSI